MPDKLKMRWLLPAISLLVFSACSKSSSDLDDDPDDAGGGSTVKTGVYHIANLAADTNATSAGDAVSLYYSLEENKVIPSSQRQTNRWDIVFHGIYNSSVFPNNGLSTGSPGYGGPGNVKLYLVVDRKFDVQYYDTIQFKPKALPIPRGLFNTAFESVKTADDTKFGTRDISLDRFQNGFDGWGYYDFYGSLFPDNPKKAHVVYTLPRVIVVKTRNGHYAKVIIENIYKDDPENPDRDNKPGFLTFKYAIQMDGSKNLDIQ